MQEVKFKIYLIVLFSKQGNGSLLLALEVNVSILENVESYMTACFNHQIMSVWKYWKYLKIFFDIFVLFSSQNYKTVLGYTQDNIV